MALTERLALLVTLDTKGAVQGFNNIGRAAERGLGKAESRIDRLGKNMQRAGGYMLAGAGLAAAGLYKAGKAAADLEQAVGGTEAVFKDASGQIDKYAKSADQAMGLSERAFREATTRLGGQLKGVGFQMDVAADKAIELTGVAADLAATYGGTTADAVDALAAAFRGEADPAERFNLRLNQNTVNAKALALGLTDSTAKVSAHAKVQATLALIMEQSADAQGQFAREADTATGAQARFTASMENAKAALGGAVAPLIADLADGLGGLTDKFNSLPPSAQNTVSKVATFGTVAVGAAGGLSFLIGKTIDARSRFADLAAQAPRTASAIGAVGKAGLTLGALSITGALLDSVFNRDHTGDINSIENALVRLAQGEALRSLNVDLEEIGEAFDRVFDPSIGERANDAMSALTGALTLGATRGPDPLGDAKEKIDGLDKALAQLAARDPDLATAALAQAAALMGREVEDLLPELDDYESALAGIDTEARTAAAGTDRFGDAAGGAAGPTGLLTGEIEDQADAFKRLANSRVDLFSADLSYRNSVADVADAQARLNELLNGGTDDTFDHAAAVRDLASAERDRARAAREVADKQAAVNALERRGHIGGQVFDDAIRELEDARDAEADAIDRVIEAQENLNRGGRETKASAAEIEQAVRDVERAMIDQAEQAVEAAGLTLDTADGVKVYRDELADLADDLAPGSPLRQRLEGYIADLDAIPESIKTNVDVQLTNEGDSLKALADFIANPGTPAPQGQDALAGLIDVLGGTPPGEPLNDLVGTAATGGLIPQYLAVGGRVRGFKRKGSDTIPLMGTPGEYMVRKPVVDRLGVPFMDWLNAGNFPSASGQTAPVINEANLAAAIRAELADLFAGLPRGDTWQVYGYPGDSALDAAKREVAYQRRLQMELANR